MYDIQFSLVWHHQQASQQVFDNNRLSMKKICLNMFLLFFTILQNDCNGQFHSEKMFWIDSMKSKDLLQQFIPSMGETGPSQMNSRV